MLMKIKTPKGVGRPARDRRGRAGACALAAVLWLAAGARSLAQAPELVAPNSADDAPPPPAAPAAEEPKTSLAEALNRAGDVTFRNMTIEAALYTIGETWRVNIVTGKEIQGTVNGVFK